MNEQQRAAEMIDKLQALEEEYGFEILHSVFTDRIIIRDKITYNDYDIHPLD